MLGKTYMAMKDKDKALLWLTKAKEYPAHTLEDGDVRTLRRAALIQLQLKG